jgi:hypothetical protein
MAKKSKRNDQEFGEDSAEIKSYLQTSEELYEDVNEDIEHLVSDAEQQAPQKKQKFWQQWSKGQKIGILSTILLVSILATLSLILFVIRPAKTDSYLKGSWHDVVSKSSDIQRASKAEVDLSGTRDFANTIYSYNKLLGSKSYEAKSKSSIAYNSSKMGDYSSLLDDLSSYFSDSATLLSKSNSEDSNIEESSIGELAEKGDKLQKRVDIFQGIYSTSDKISSEVLDLDMYIKKVKLNLRKSRYDQEKTSEESAKKAAEAKDRAKQAQDKADVEALADSYYKALINASEEGVRATLSKGFTGEYDFKALKPEARASFYPKSYRMISVEKDGDNYKLSTSVNYAYVYQDSEGQNQENASVSTEIYRAVYNKDLGAWKIDGAIVR